MQLYLNFPTFRTSLSNQSKSGRAGDGQPNYVYLSQKQREQLKHCFVVPSALSKLKIVND